MSVFTIDQARALLPQIRQMTREAVSEVQTLAERAHGLSSEDPERDRVGRRAQEVVQAWAESVMELGAEVKGLWLVDFDSGDGYWCWKHPEESLEYFHTYDGGFRARRLIAPEILH